MIQISPSAAREIGRLMSKQRYPNMLFRLQVQAGGCSGVFYDMKFDQLVGQADQVYNYAGIPVVIDDQSLDYINGLMLDYSEDLMGGGFRFHNPNAKHSCGCGNSFSVKEPD